MHSSSRTRRLSIRNSVRRLGGKAGAKVDRAISEKGRHKNDAGVERGTVVHVVVLEADVGLGSLKGWVTRCRVLRGIARLFVFVRAVV